MNDQTLQWPSEATPATIVAYVENAISQTEASIKQLEADLAHQRNSLVHCRAILLAVQFNALRQTN